MLTGLDLLIIGVTGVSAGFVNAIAGGGTLLTFPVLTAVGVPAVAANVTNTVALCTGFFGASYAQRADFRGQEKRLRLALPAAAIGGLIGGYLLLHTREQVFRRLVPFLILLATGLLAAQDTLRAWLQRRAERRAGAPVRTSSELRVAIILGLGAVYGGYFGAGLSVIMLAVLGLLLDDSLTRLNALKSAMALCSNLTAAILFLFSGRVFWSAAVVMAIGALSGSMIGGRLASKVKPRTLRRVVVTIGCIVGGIYLIK